VRADQVKVRLATAIDVHAADKREFDQRFAWMQVCLERFRTLGPAALARSEPC
jgi:hypothetical protein